MRRYRSRLDSVLRARRAQEELARQALARANAVLRGAEDKYREERSRYESLAVTAGIQDRESFRQSRLSAELTAATLAAATRNREKAAVIAAVHHAAWREAAQRVASLERLDARRRAENALEGMRGEAIEIDDVVASRWDVGEADPHTRSAVAGVGP